MLAYQEATDDKLRAGANEAFDIWLVFQVQWHRNWLSHRFHPLSFEVSPPLRELAETTCFIQHDVKFPVVCRCKFRNQDPCEQVQARQTEMLKVVPLHATPTTCDSDGK